MKLIYLLVTASAVIFCGCFSVLTICDLPDSKVVAPVKDYSNEKGKELALKYERDLNLLIPKIHRKFSCSDLQFMKNSGLYFGYMNEDPGKSPYLVINMFSTTIWNIYRLDFASRYSTAFLQFGRTLLSAGMDADFMKDTLISGICISLQWSKKDFWDEYSSSEAERFSIWSTTENIKDFLNNKISNQQFVNRAIILGYQGKVDLGIIELDLQKGM